MKKTLCFIAAALTVIVGCTKYEFNTEFSVPTELVSPDAVTLDVTSSKNVVLSWNGSAAADGGILLYNVLFDKENGDFSEPIATMPSDLGARNTLTLSHAMLNTIARKAGIAPDNTGSLIWTVTASKGGISKKAETCGTLRVTRGEGIDNIPEHLYIGGSAASEAGQEFRAAEEGIFVIYTELGTGELKFTSEKNGGFTFYADGSKKLIEGEGTHKIETAPETGLARLTVNFNTLGFTIEEVAKEVRCIWGANYADIAVLEYAGNGDFVGDGDVIFLGPGRDGTPDWCSWVEERYYFIATVNGEERCWGSTFGGGSWTPDGTEEFWYVEENPWDQWSNLWKMDHAYDLCHVTFTISTNKNNKMTHSYTGGAIEYEQPSAAPAELSVSGPAAESDNQVLRKEGDKFILYNKFNDGEISLVDENGTKYFADEEGRLFIGSRKTSVAASEAVGRMIVDFVAKTVSFDEIGPDVYVENAWDHIVMATLTYQGLGKWAGEGKITFAANGDERYSLRTLVNGENRRWGSNKGNDGTAPDGTDEFWYIYEHEWDDWNNLWKFNKEDKDLDALFTVDGNNPVHMTHSVSVVSEEPATPSIAPSDLAIYGSAAETEGAAFRKVKDGVFEIVAKLKEGKLNFKSGSANYFFNSDRGLLQGKGESDATASESGFVTRITVDFITGTVKLESLDEWIHLKFAADYRDIANLQYQGNGVWKASDVTVKFIDPNDAGTNPPSWLSWLEERYYFIIKVDGTEKCWGRLDSVTGDDQKPNDDPNFYHINEFDWSQWDHTWKFAGEMNGATVDIQVNFNNNGVWEHSITKK